MPHGCFRLRRHRLRNDIDIDISIRTSTSGRRRRRRRQLPIGVGDVNDSLGGKPRRRSSTLAATAAEMLMVVVVGVAEELRAVPGGPQIEAAGLLKAIGEDLQLLVGGDGEEGGGSGVDTAEDGGGGGLPGLFELGDGGFELGSLAHLVDVAFASEAGLEELLRFFGLHSLPLPLGDAAGVRPGASAHADDGGRVFVDYWCEFGVDEGVVEEQPGCGCGCGWAT